MECGSVLPLFRREACFACSKRHYGTTAGEARLA